ncbi:hypothetical protein HMPREF1548_05841 [Clostridium sp. KLE 1755]|nr:hypothetical protein HMPREF1548_05841 [Clostridium sp. KLE 1755]
MFIELMLSRLSIPGKLYLFVESKYNGCALRQGVWQLANL